MYRIGRRSKKKAKKLTWFSILGLLLVPLVGVGFFTYKIMQEGEVEPTQPQAITRQYAASETHNKKTFDQEEFSIALPNDWVLKAHTTTPHNMYAWQATKKNADNRWLEVYVDRYPTDKAFNRLLPVSVENNKIIVTGSVSENCTAFTGSQKPDGTPAATVDKMPAKWLGIDFMCDIANYTRNVVGVGTIGSQNKLVMTGPKGQRTFFIVYIDHNINPNYQLLEEALSSLTVK